MGTWNTNSWSARCNENSQFRESVLLNLDLDILCVNETFLLKNDKIQVSNYHWFGHNRKIVHRRARRGAGGVGIFVHNRVFQYFKVDTLDNDVEDVFWIKLSARNGDMVICLCSCYLPPKDSSHRVEGDIFFSNLMDQVYSYQNEGIICICGDVNARIGELQDMIEGVDDVPLRDVLDDVLNNYGDIFHAHLTDCNMCILNGRCGDVKDNQYTHISKKGKSVVDYVWVPYEQLHYWESFQVLTVSDIIDTYNMHIPASQPDHSVLVWKCRLPSHITVDKNEHKIDGEDRETHSVKNIPDNFFNDTEAINAVERAIADIERHLDTDNQINKAYAAFVDTLMTEMDKKLPIKRIKTSITGTKPKLMYKPYWSDNLQQVWNEKVTAEKRWVKEKGPSKGRQKAIFCDKQRCFDRILKKAKRSYQRQQLQELEGLYEAKDHASFWKKIGKIGLANERKQYIPWEIVNDEGNIRTNHDDVVDKWREDFASIYENVGAVNPDFDDAHLNRITAEMNEEVTPNMQVDTSSLDQDISLDEVKSAVAGAKLRKARGIDDIPTEVLKSDQCITMLHKIISFAFEKGIVPSEWNKGIIHPIPKSSSNDPRVPLNYRGITLISIPCKIYCSVLNRRLTKWLEANNLLVNEQNGFRPKRSCIDHIYSLTSVINLQKSKKKPTYVCYVDAKKAFDCINRSCLWYKMQKMGINGKMFQAIKSLYADVECCVRINGTLSKWFKVNNGVKQGCMLSPALFSIFINDLATEIKNLQCGIPVGDDQISILMFADDIALISETEESMQLMLNKLHQWCNKWRLNLNMDKTKLVHYRIHGQDRSHNEFKFGEDTIQIVDKYKYLGLWIHEHLDYKVTVQPLASSAGRALGCLITKFRYMGNMNHSVFTRLYDCLVLPVLNYGAGIWGTASYGCANTIQNRACRFFLGVGKNTSNIATRGEMGWMQQIHRQYMEVLRLYCRLQSMPRDRINGLIHQYCLNSRAMNTWERKVKNMFHKIGFMLPNGPLNTSNVVGDFKKCLGVKDQAMWWQELFNDSRCDNGNKLRTYRIHKSILETEHYVKSLSRYERSTLTRLRCGSLPLKIETGRYKKEPLPTRICTLCSQNNIENEIHFLVDCDFYDDLRYEMMLKFKYLYCDFNEQQSLAKYALLMSNQDQCKLVAKTVDKMFKRRRIFV